MKTLLVQSLPLHEVIENLAEAMNTTFTQSCDQYKLVIPESFGTGTVMGIDFESGMGIIQYDCTFNDDIELKFIVNKIHPLKFLYCLEGTITHCFENSKKSHQLKQHQNAMVASSNNHGHILHFQKNVTTKISSLELSRKQFLEKSKCELESLEPTTRKIFYDVDANEEFYYEGFYSLQLANMFDQMHQFEGQEFLKRVYLEGKSNLILTRQIMQFEDDLLATSDRKILRTSELKQIRKAAEFIDQNIHGSISIQDISQHVGLNGNKLQSGFQKLFEKSVNQYIQKQRMQLARHLVENTDKTISEICDIVGLNSRSYFSKIFKEEYGVNPSELKQKNGSAFL
ncbi:helix-turn-helix domain-containing protein [Aegicerativicinus sediminis]|uniref:helix-turn-helix domain-containing protein n=1 Tax=Aegicerativicinus sediminis TaxID=2893202 RepID=UPI001E3C6C84|nr:AraC family transcriptional regulator [Aegicerativicinus sediminis]